MGVVGKTAAGAVFAACLLVGSLVGLLLGDASLGGNVGALVGLLIIAVNVTLSLRYMRRRFDPVESRAEGERLARDARLPASDPDE
jgi:hypothetical protein